MYHVPMHVGKSVPPTLVLEDQLLVVDSHQVQKGSLKIVYVDTILNNIVAVRVGFAVNHTGSHTAARHPDRKAARMMIATKVAWREFALAIIRTTKFATPYD